MGMTVLLILAWLVLSAVMFIWWGRYTDAFLGRKLSAKSALIPWLIALMLLLALWGITFLVRLATPSN